ncbi:acetyltransferase [Streptomyces sp. CB03234]|uniref:GNAT family N-acetyltransferase n=1 Tax=Streptomyces sp. (strain CB03234) TaxID=1703937 RepID=UPI00093FB44F|nr:GNAT family N-acetyltransferase [Streptomyces sp. CB03234]OKK07541.1 acetyltransferase [Streptomyces sp. CB03234]
MEPVTLTTERLRLRPFTPADTDAVYAACQDPDIQRWTVVPSPYERQHAEDFLGRIVPDGWRTGYDLDFAVLPRAGGPLVGAIGVRGHSGVWEIGFWTAKEHRGNGYATEAVVALARWTFTTTGCTRLVWRAEVGNTGSRAVAEKAGFTVEGVQRAGLLNKGTLRDAWIGSLLPSDLGLPSTVPYLPARPNPA